MNESIKAAKVHLLDLPFHLDKTYEYFIPQSLREDIHAGVFAEVPFGGGNKHCLALVSEVSETSEFPLNKLKPIIRLSDAMFELTDEQIKLASFIAERTFCSFGEALRAMLPPAAFAKIRTVYRLCEELPGSLSLSEEAQRLFEIMQNEHEIAIERIKSLMGDYADGAVSELLKRGVICRDYMLDEKTNRKYINYYSLSDEALAYFAGTKKLRSKKQENMLTYVRSHKHVSEAELKKILGCTRAQITSLTGKGLLVEEKVDVFRDPYAGSGQSAQDIVLNDEQSAAKDTLVKLATQDKPTAALLYGVTGSGKTSVIKEVTDAVLAMGRQVIILVPEIALTPQTVKLFKSFYGDNIAVYHSSLSAGERLDAYRRFAEGKTNVCIGTRSAIFAPFKNLGMIVIDEEQEHTYKSDMTPKFSTVDVAGFRCGYHNSLMLLSSATPSLGSMYKALTGKYTLVMLKNRYGKAVLPETVVSDMRDEFRSGTGNTIGVQLRSELRRVMENGEQAVIFLNRRGYNNYMMCPTCGEVIMCPHCSVSLTHHSYPGYDRLICHYCGHTETPPHKCPSCGSEIMVFMGYGTQKVEEELRGLFPDKKIIRMDADTTSGKFAHDEIIEKFRDHEADILIGTQMVTKGHNFPDVTLSAVLSADMSLYLDDFRAPERTFSQITQLVGRSGRTEKPGKALIQTFNPDHPVLILSAKQDYDEFYKNEIAVRKALLFPPFCDIILISFTAKFEPELNRTAAEFLSALKRAQSEKYSDIPLIVFGPFEAPVYKVNDRYRSRIIVKTKSVKRSRKMFAELMRDFGFKLYGHVTISIDVNPNSL